MCTFHYIIFIGACNDLDSTERCEDSATICEAVFVTKGATCDTHCQSLGFICEEAWDEKYQTCDSKLRTDARRVGNGCGMSYNDQICRCTTDRGKSIIVDFSQNLLYAL